MELPNHPARCIVVYSDQDHLLVSPVASAASRKPRGAKVDDATMAELQSIECRLAATDWRERLLGVEQLAELVRMKPSVVLAHITKVRHDCSK